MREDVKIWWDLAIDDIDTAQEVLEWVKKKLS